MNISTIDMGDVVHRLTMTITVTRSRRHRLRMWIGLRVMRLGALLAGFGAVDVGVEE